MKILKNQFKLLLTLLIFASMASCHHGHGDDDGITPDELEQAREEALESLSQGDSQVWKILEAGLFVDGNLLDITHNFNVVDDEFIFSQDMSLSWRQGNAINQNATNIQESLLDFYLGPIASQIEFLPNSASEFTAFGATHEYRILSESSLVVSIQSPTDNNMLVLRLKKKRALDYKSVPDSGLDFNFVTTINAPRIYEEGSAGFIGSYSNNSFYLVHRDDTQSGAMGSPERIVSYNFDTTTLSENLFFESDFVTKRLNIINNELVAFGGNKVNRYDLDPSGPANSTFNHGLFLTRFGFTVQDQFAYVVGRNFTSPGNATISRYDYNTNALEVLGELPTSRVHGAAEIVNNQLYVFGGRDAFVSDNIDATSYIYDIDSGALSTFEMTAAPTNSFAARVENLIYVGYETRSPVGDPGLFDDDRNIRFGVYNTLDNTFVDVSHNLDDSDLTSSIHAITIFNGVLYVVYGSSDSDPNYTVFGAEI